MSSMLCWMLSHSRQTAEIWAVVRITCQLCEVEADCDPAVLQISDLQCNPGLHCSIQNAAVKVVQYQQSSQSWTQVDLTSCTSGLWHFSLHIPLGLAHTEACLQEQVTQEYQKAISKQLSFTLHLFRGRPTSASTRRLVIAHFKAAATEHINSRTPLVGVPGSVAWRNGEAGHLYFVTVQRHEEPDVG